MGTKKVRRTTDPDVMRAFIARLLDDVRTLERMLADGEIETGVRRLGAELEMFVVDRTWRPATIGPQVMSRVSQPRLTSELGAFNLELNADPLPLGGRCFSDLERELTALLGEVREAALACDGDVVLAGILPTLRPSDLGIESMTPEERYYALNEAMTALRGANYRIFIKGIDELLVEHDSVMLEACNTSFQLHLQVDPDQFAHLYNVSLLALAPLLASATYSPMLFGRRLWHETRIALFQQSVDTRVASPDMRLEKPRVRIGDGWIRESVLEIFRDDIARFRPVLALDGDEETPADGIPRLGALQLFNGTVYRWLRPCYGVGGGKPHLRIENRVLPSGPTPPDLLANAAFWYGLVEGLAARVEEVPARIAFDDVRGNFFAAARLGLGAPLAWLDGQEITARTLILDHLLDIARDGLASLDIDSGDADGYLDIVRQRVELRRTGSEWMLESLAALSTGNRYESARALTAAIARRQRENRPVHEWKEARRPHRAGGADDADRVEGYMQTDLVTANEADSLDLVAHLMLWRGIRHIPVEDREHRLVGLVTRGRLFRFLTSTKEEEPLSVPVSKIMERNLVTAPPETSTRDAIRLMRERKISGLPVVRNGQLVGLVTERDFMALAAELLSERYGR